MAPVSENPTVTAAKPGGVSRGEAALNSRRPTNSAHLSLLPSPSVKGDDRSVLNEESFHRMIALERKRSERSDRPFLLVLLDMGKCNPGDRTGKAMTKLLSVLGAATRDTDVIGWYEDHSIVGVMYTEMNMEDRNAIVTTIMGRVTDTLSRHLSFDQFNHISMSFHLFPEEWDHESPRRPSNPTLYPDLPKRERERKTFNITKRLMDVLGSLLAVIFFSPVFLAIALAVKATSKGPVLFRQKRVGQYGESFTFLKFRSMHVNNDASLHKQYVTELISGTAERKPAEGAAQGIYKLTKDPRITRVGSFLRRTSLDELPQFFNVISGEMSLVGPRPAIAYEVEAYDTWHRRRVLEAKPGITGLWQVKGRSRVTFDDMVRLDLEYARSWSPWMDVKILLQTPGAMLGAGAC